MSVTPPQTWRNVKTGDTTWDTGRRESKRPKLIRTPETPATSRVRQRQAYMAPDTVMKNLTSDFKGLKPQQTPSEKSVRLGPSVNWDPKDPSKKPFRARHQKKYLQPFGLDDAYCENTTCIPENDARRFATWLGSPPESAYQKSIQLPKGTKLMDLALIYQPTIQYFTHEGLPITPIRLESYFGQSEAGHIGRISPQTPNYGTPDHQAHGSHAVPFANMTPGEWATQESDFLGEETKLQNTTPERPTTPPNRLCPLFMKGMKTTPTSASRKQSVSPYLPAGSPMNIDFCPKTPRNAFPKTDPVMYRSREVGLRRQSFGGIFGAGMGGHVAKKMRLGGSPIGKAVDELSIFNNGGGGDGKSPVRGRGMGGGHVEKKPRLSGSPAGKAVDEPSIFNDGRPPKQTLQVFLQNPDGPPESVAFPYLLKLH
ncbi:hypothetical protein HK097_005394 [Rhizophlyctis rosea]|uniref:Uncharacterized protein n=1 Tax=Rhizophlyctis rosea TaxID=64517 RepID=A0AAD5WYF5_9FUNG|nr:hypothetical protein HK097_005394 [Rhizophlyctis rosea]